MKLSRQQNQMYRAAIFTAIGPSPRKARRNGWMLRIGSEINTSRRPKAKGLEFSLAHRFFFFFGGGDSLTHRHISPSPTHRWSAQAPISSTFFSSFFVGFVLPAASVGAGCRSGTPTSSGLLCSGWGGGLLSFSGSKARTARSHCQAYK